MTENETNLNVGSDIFMNTTNNGEEIRRSYGTKPWKSDYEIYNPKSEEGNSDNEIEYVDLGLPSGLLWATCNLGASSPIEAGKYYQWGDTEGYYENQIGDQEGQKIFYWNTYKYAEMVDKQHYLTKYCDNSEYGYEGYTDDLVELEPSDDAATVELGNGWRIPSYDDFQELLDNTEPELDESGNIILHSTINDNSITFSCVGIAVNDTIVYESEGRYVGTYWSSTLSEAGSGFYFIFNNNPEDIGASIESDEKCLGMQIRPVLVQTN